MLNNQSLFRQDKTAVRPLTEFEMYKLYCQFAGRDFDIKNMPVEMRVHTNKGVHIFPAGSEITRFREDGEAWHD